MLIHVNYKINVQIVKIVKIVNNRLKKNIILIK